MMCNKIIDFQNTKSFRKKQAETQIPVYSHSVSAGTLSSVTDNYVEKVVTLNSLKLDSLKGKRPEHLAIITISGDSMFPLLKDKQKVVIDRILPFTLSLNEMIGKIIIARIDSDYTIKRFDADNKYFYLIPENKEFEVIKVNKNYEYFTITGVMVDVLDGTSSVKGEM